MTDARAVVALLAATAALAAGAFAWIYGAHLTYDDALPIRSDGAGYYVYLPAVLINGDLSLRTTGRREYGSPVSIPGVHRWGHTRPPRYIDEYGIGVAVLTTPFFLAASFIAVTTGAEADGYSWPYQAFAAAAGCAYALLGLWLLAGVLRRFFTRAVVLATLAGTVFGGALFQYATYDATLSHAFAFFLVALVLRLSLALWERPRTATVVALAAAIGLVGLVRLTDLPVVILPALVGIRRPHDLRLRVAALARHVRLVALGAAVFAAVMAPQFLYWHWVTGHFFVEAYPNGYGRLNLLAPHLLDVFFSVRKGLLYWTPLLLVAIAGLPLLRRAAPPLFVPAVAYLVVQTWIVASWSLWWYGGSFGMRALIDVLPVFALGLAALLDAASRTSPFARRALAVAVVATSLLTVHGMVAYWLKTIPIDGTTVGEYFHSFVHY